MNADLFCHNIHLLSHLTSALVSTKTFSVFLVWQWPDVLVTFYEAPYICSLSELFFCAPIFFILNCQFCLADLLVQLIHRCENKFVKSQNK